MHDRWRVAGRFAWALCVACASSLAWVPPVFAFSDPFSYENPIDLGGGGGRWFTGSPADGYGCDVCHEGGEPARLSVTGLPLAGYQPGSTYEVVLGWGVGAPHVAMIAEVADETGLPAGVLELPPVTAMTAAERCNEEFMGLPGSELHEGADGRQFVSVIDCGAQVLRFRWTAPTVDVGTVYLAAGLVTSDENADPLGDGVTMVRRPMPSAAEGFHDTQLVEGGCTVPGGFGARAPPSGASVMAWMGVMVGLWVWKRGRR